MALRKRRERESAIEALPEVAENVTIGAGTEKVDEEVGNVVKVGMELPMYLN